MGIRVTVRTPSRCGRNHFQSSPCRLFHGRSLVICIPVNTFLRILSGTILSQIRHGFHPCSRKSLTRAFHPLAAANCRHGTLSILYRQGAPDFPRTTHQAPLIPLNPFHCLEIELPPSRIQVEFAVPGPCNRCFTRTLPPYSGIGIVNCVTEFRNCLLN